MLKKLSIAGLAFIASSGIAFADTSDSMSASDTNGDASMNNAVSDTSASSTSSTHKKYRKHRKHHYKKHHQSAQPVVADPDPAPSALKADYKGEVAAPCPTCPVPFMAGAYLGLSVGSRVNYTSTPAVYNGLEGTLFGGYGWLWDQAYAGLEIFVQDSISIINNSSSVGSARSTWGYGLSVLPGYLLVDNVLGYLRLGVVRTRFSTGNSNRTGGQIGLGLDTALCNNWDLRGEYVYSFYNSLSNGGSPKSQQFNLGLIYKFQM